MIRRGRVMVYKVIRISLFLELLSLKCYSNSSDHINISRLTFNFTHIPATPLFHFILTLMGLLIIICTIVIFFSIKLKRVNRELQEKNKEILKINLDLQRTNVEMEDQKEIFTKNHYESEKFYRILVQSANDGIAFYDRDWNLKYANPAFYSMIGLDYN
ncbi:MAG: PAS domain-containing protein, partial [Bacteroidetes bacterium]